jgi:hypothetical protein
MKYKIFPIFVLLFAISFNIMGQTEWKLRKNSNGIKVYTRKNSNTNLVEFKATTVINAKKEDILKILEMQMNIPIGLTKLNMLN